jgi:hypothetical protein
MRAEILAHNDANRNGKLDADEKAAIRDRLTLGRLKALEMYDQNRDGRLDGAERKAAATGAIVAPDANKPGSVDTQAKDAGSPTLSNVMVTGAGTGDADIGFALGRETQVTIRVYDAAGRVVHTVASNQLMSAGSHAIRWDGRASGGRVANGMYLIRVDAFGQKVTKKFAMVK